MHLHDARFTVVDVETTGLSPHQHRITEIALLTVENGKITNRFESLINPEQYIPPFIAEYTGITNAMVYGKPTFRELAPTLSKFATGGVPTSLIIAGHNVSFDAGFLRSSFDRSGLPLFDLANPADVLFLCTCRLARRMLPQLSRKGLKSVADHFGIKIKKQHRAMGDAEATAKVLLQFLEIAENDYGLDQVNDIVQLQTRRVLPAPRRTKAAQSVRDKVKEFPERPGVYIMYGAKGSVLYVGKAKSLRDRVSSYFTRSAAKSNSKLARMMKAVREINYEETGSELSALLLESRKIKEVSPRFNTLERRYKNYTFLKLDIEHPFPRLYSVKEPAADGAEYYGPFRSHESTSALIEVLNRNFKLRECGDEFSVSPNNKPCFYHDIGRCDAPCAKLETKGHYRKEVERLQQFLSAGEEGIISLVQNMMTDAADRLDFEEAQFLKMRLFELRKVLGGPDREDASLNANDFVIITKAQGGAEVFFVRYGRLVKQLLITEAALPGAEEWFYKQLRLYYNEASQAIPPQCGKPEVDEMRILASYTDRKRREGSVVVYLTNDWETVVPRLVRELNSVFTSVPRKTKRPLVELVASTGGDALAGLSPEAFSTAKRLTLKPMFDRRQ